MKKEVVIKYVPGEKEIGIYIDKKLEFSSADASKIGNYVRGLNKHRPVLRGLGDAEDAIYKEIKGSI